MEDNISDQLMTHILARSTEAAATYHEEEFGSDDDDWSDARGMLSSN